ncbi:MAG TPA: UDP-N-acetylmuramoyl-L-alanine--D-glutamate ligase [Ignavibacteriaceae bacterium]|nr:UDP-N-acetylmuramoyl-L-alanine--D-glutamate ligase [Ignavibacteriaceae bacterium]
MEIKGKNISVIGAVRSGIGAAKMIKKLGGIPFVSDSSDTEKLRQSVLSLADDNIEFELGVHSDKVYNCTMMVVSPGVPSDSIVVKKAKEKKIKIISEIELAAAFCKGHIIAITGTNGKTTTTTLCGYVFNHCGKKTFTAGNIGLAFSEIALDVNVDEFVALEVSSFQLDFIDKFKPKVAIILNITPDHLNRYENKYENYAFSKLKIFENQNHSDFLIMNKDSKDLMKFFKSSGSVIINFSTTTKMSDGCWLDDETVSFQLSGYEKFNCRRNDISLPGEHNLSNTMAVICAAKIFGLNSAKIIEALKLFKGVEHRLEFVREIDGVKYINDSKGTNVDSVWFALRSFDSPIFLILGGQDKGNDYNQIKDLVIQNVKKIFAIGSSAEKVFNFFHAFVKVEIKESLQSAVLSANQEAREGEIVLLSPACASFDMFDNYEHRGRVFKEAVFNL